MVSVATVLNFPGNIIKALDKNETLITLLTFIMWLRIVFFEFF